MKNLSSLIPVLILGIIIGSLGFSFLSSSNDSKSKYDNQSDPLETPSVEQQQDIKPEKEKVFLEISLGEYVNNCAKSWHELQREERVGKYVVWTGWVSYIGRTDEGDRLVLTMYEDWLHGATIYFPLDRISDLRDINTGQIIQISGLILENGYMSNAGGGSAGEWPAFCKPKIGDSDILRIYPPSIKVEDTLRSDWLQTLPRAPDVVPSEQKKELIDTQATSG